MVEISDGISSVGNYMIFLYYYHIIQQLNWEQPINCTEMGPLGAKKKVPMAKLPALLFERVLLG